MTQGTGNTVGSVLDGGHRRRDLGSAALVVSLSLTLLALAQPVATTTVRARSGSSASSSGWFGSVTSTVGGVTTQSAGTAPPFGWAVGVGVVALAAAALLRWRRGGAPILCIGAGAWLLTTGALVLLHTAARVHRVRDVLDPVVPAQVTLHPSAAPWLIIAAGALAVAAAFTPARRAPVVAPRPEPGLVTWTPVEPGAKS